MMLFKRVKAKEHEAIKNTFDDQSSIGNILVDLGRITVDELRSAIGHQAHFNDALIGSLLCKHGVTTNSDIAKALNIQEKIRSGQAVQAGLDVLESKLIEAVDSGHRLSQAIKAKKQERRERGDKPGLFIVTSTSVIREA